SGAWIAIWTSARVGCLLQDMRPEPLAVATWIEKSLTTGGTEPERSAVFSSRTVLKTLLLLDCFPISEPVPEPRMIPKRAFLSPRQRADPSSLRSRRRHRGFGASASSGLRVGFS